MADQRDIRDILNAHHPDQLTAFFVTVELHAACKFMAEFRFRHVRLFQAVIRNRATIGAGAIIDDRGYSFKVRIDARANH